MLLILRFRKSNFHSFTDDYTITATFKTLTVSKLVQRKRMAFHVDKFQAIILDKKESEAEYKLAINNNDIESIKFVKL